MQAVLELLGVPFVGTPAPACRLAWDKPTAKAELAARRARHPGLGGAAAQHVPRARRPGGARRDGRPARPAADGQAGPGRLGARRAGGQPSRRTCPRRWSSCLRLRRHRAGRAVRRRASRWRSSVVEDDDGAARAARRSRSSRRAASTTTRRATPPGCDRTSTARPGWTTRSRPRCGDSPSRAHQAARPAGRLAHRRDRRRRRAGAVPRGQRLAGPDRDLAAADGGGRGRPDLGDLCGDWSSGRSLAADAVDPLRST